MYTEARDRVKREKDADKGNEQWAVRSWPR